MPRGVKSTKSVEDQIAGINEKIKSLKAKVSALEIKKKSLKAIKEKADMDELYKAVKASGKSAAELVAELKK